MGRSFSFAEKDRELIEEIKEFQKNQRLPSFIEAVRILCENGLHINEILKNNK